MFSTAIRALVIGMVIVPALTFAQILPDKTPRDKCKNFRISIEKKGLQVAPRGGYEYVSDFLIRCLAAGSGSLKCSNLAQKALSKESGILCDGKARNCGFVEYLPFSKEELQDKREWKLLCADRCDPTCAGKVDEVHSVREGIQKQKERFKLEPPDLLEEKETPEGIPYEEYKKFPDPRVFKVFLDETDSLEAPARTDLGGRVEKLLQEFIPTSYRGAKTPSTFEGLQVEWSPQRMPPSFGFGSTGFESPEWNTDRFVSQSTFGTSPFLPSSVWSQIRFVNHI